MPSHPDRVRRNYPEGVPAFGVEQIEAVEWKPWPSEWAEMWREFHSSDGCVDCHMRNCDHHDPQRLTRG